MIPLAVLLAQGCVRNNNGMRNSNTVAGKGVGIQGINGWRTWYVAQSHMLETAHVQGIQVQAASKRHMFKAFDYKLQWASWHMCMQIHCAWGGWVLQCP